MWLPIVIFAYFLNAIAIVIDKFLLGKRIPEPVVYTFWIAALGLLAVVLLPFGFALPDWQGWAIDFLAGFSFVAALLAMFTALKQTEASRVSPFIGGLSPIFVFLIAFLFLGERLAQREIWAFLFLLLGSFLISLDFGEVKKSGRRAFYFAFLAAFLFGLSYGLTKLVFNQQPFISGFVWIRVGAFVGALFLLLWPKARQAILHPPATAGETKGIFLFGQACGAGSFLLVNYAIALASVTLVNVLQGVQYVFLLAMTIFISQKMPQLFREKTTKAIILQKIAAIVLIAAGLALIALK